MNTNRTKMSSFCGELPRGPWWADQVKTSKVIDRTWEILNKEFADRTMDALHAKVNNYGVTRRDPKSLACYETLISVYVSNIEVYCP